MKDFSQKPFQSKQIECFKLFEGLMPNMTYRNVIWLKISS